MLGNILKSFLYIFAILIVITTIFVVWISKNLPDYKFLKKYYPPLVTKIYSSDGKLMDEVYREYRLFTNIKDIPIDLIQAFIIAEDKNFFTHIGFDAFGILRALKNNITKNKSNIQGASTITQQVVKNFLLTSDRLISRKIKEIILAYKISRVFSKEHVLELYLNQIYLGNGSYGVTSAALNYFNKNLNELTLDECALLAALPKSPSKLNPKKYYQRALDRRNYVLNRMLQADYISEERFQQLKNKKIVLKNFVNTNKIEAKYYTEKVKKEVIEIFGEDFLYTAGLTIITCLDSKIHHHLQESLREGIINYDKRNFYKSVLSNIPIDNWQNDLKEFKTLEGMRDARFGVVLKINDTVASVGLSNGTITNIYLNNSRWTKKDIRALSEILEVGDVILVRKLNKSRYILFQIPEVEGALMILNQKTGKLLASEGGYDFNRSQFDRASQAERQIGSLIKPFIYLTALENGILPNEIFYDEYIEIYQGEDVPIWIPKNHDEKFLGPITLRTALERSRNAVTVRVAQTIGQKEIGKTLKKLSISSQEPKIDSLALGAINTTLEKITTAYGVIGNNGKEVIPQCIELIKDREGNVLFKRRTEEEYINCNQDILKGNILFPIVIKNAKTKLINKASNYQILSILEGAVKRGTARLGKNINLKNIAGKTGTTNNGTDTWTIAFTPEIVIGSFIGFDNSKTLGENSFGANTTLPIINNLLKKLIQNNLIKTDQEFKIPKEIVFMPINYDTGKIIVSEDKSKSDNSTKIIQEAFKIENFNTENF